VIVNNVAREVAPIFDPIQAACSVACTIGGASAHFVRKYKVIVINCGG